MCARVFVWCGAQVLRNELSRWTYIFLFIWGPWIGLFGFYPLYIRQPDDLSPLFQNLGIFAVCFGLTYLTPLLGALQPHLEERVEALAPEECAEVLAAARHLKLRDAPVAEERGIRARERGGQREGAYLRALFSSSAADY